MNWEYIWNNREFNEKNIYDFNGYPLKNYDEYNNLINEITKDLDIKIKNPRILDLGCGNASFTNIMLKNKNIIDYKLYGIDYSIKNIDYANNNFTGYFYNKNIKDKLLFEDNFFDVILCISTIFYLNDKIELDNLISEIKRVSKPNNIIFFGNCLDENKKEIAKEIRRKTHGNLNSNHLYININDIKKHFENSNISISHNNLDFYEGSKYKFNILIENDNNNHNNNNNNIGIDYHDTLTYNTVFFKNILKNWNGLRVIITGTPKSKEKQIIEELKKLNFYQNYDYDSIEFGYEYEKSDMNYSHFIKMREHKLNKIKNNNIDIYFDDNPYYVNYLKDHNVTVFQTILSKSYIDKFNKDKYFCCNLQENQFNFLTNYQNKKKIFTPGVFDLFHIGHLKYINKIKEHNYYIILGIQDDKSCSNCKRKPIMNTQERVDFIKELNLVDDIVIYESRNHIDIIKKYNIEIFIIGPEYGNCDEHTKTLDYCNLNNIEVKIINRTNNISTTDIINRIIN